MDRKILHALIDSSGAHYKRSRQEFQKMDLSPGQPKVLSYLYDHEGCSQKELAERCGVEPATMTILLRNIALKGLIKKKAANLPCGKRAFIISLTEFGREQAERANAIIDALEIVSMKGFTEGEKAALLGMLKRVTDNLTESEKVE